MYHKSVNDESLLTIAFLNDTKMTYTVNFEQLMV